MEFKGIKYSPQTGLFWRCYKGHGKIKPFQKIIRSPDKDGYLRLQYQRKTYKQHRIAWMIMNGGKEIPEGMVIDHINGNKQDNRWCNLRLVSYRENAQNRVERKKKLCAFKKRGIYESYISVDDNGHKYLGSYKTEIEAHTAVLNYMDEHNIPYLPEIDKRIPDIVVPKYIPPEKQLISYKGETITLNDAAKNIGVSPSAFRQRKIRNGWDFQKTFDHYLKNGPGRKKKEKYNGPKRYRKRLVI